jgi:hypothetical protein
MRDHKDAAVGLCRMQHALGGFGIERHGLFAKDMAAPRCGFNRGLLVEVGRDTDDYGVKLLATQEVPVTGVTRPLPAPLPPALARPGFFGKPPDEPARYNPSRRFPD